MAKIDKKFHNLLGTILAKGFRYEDSNRKGTYRIQIPSYSFEWDFKDGFPALTTKKLWWKGVVGELLFFLQGDMDIRKLWKNKIHIWDKDAYNYYVRQKAVNENPYSFEAWKETLESNNPIDNDGEISGDLGRIYGAQWRKWIGMNHNSKQASFFNYDDQFQLLIKSLKSNPMSTSNIVTAWNPSEKKEMALPPCHWSFEILSRPLSDREISDSALALCIDKSRVGISNFSIGDALQQVPKHAFTLKWHQRSVDTFLGLPFNIASYALLAQIIGKMTNMIPEGIIGDLSNVHIYEPHMDAVKEQLSRDTDKHGDCDFFFDYDTEKMLESPSLVHTFDKILNQLKIKDFHLKDYKHYPSIRAEMLAYDKK